MNNKKYKCTSVKLKEYLMSKGFRYIWVGKNDRGFTYWEFDVTDNFSQALSKWSSMRS